MKNVRKQFIIDCVKRYKTKEKKDFKNFTAALKQQKANMNDREYGKLNGAEDMRLALRIPEKLYSMLIYVLDGHNEEGFLEPSDERAWFAKKFPEFVISRKY